MSLPQPEPEPRKKRLNTSMKSMLVTVTVLLLVVGVAISFSVASGPAAPAQNTAGASETVAAETHVLDDVGVDAPTLVEFLDFECEACGALYPYIEEVREHYDGKINYAVRYFPLSGHKNSMNAAIAVEAAAQQGQFEEMFHRMFETQKEWGEKQTSEAERFRGFAQDLDLDMSAYDEAVASPATQERVQRDFDAGVSLGVQSTPSFFLNGELLELTDPNDLPNAIESALE